MSHLYNKINAEAFLNKNGSHLDCFTWNILLCCRCYRHQQKCKVVNKSILPFCVRCYTQIAPIPPVAHAPPVVVYIRMIPKLITTAYAKYNYHAIKYDTMRHNHSSSTHYAVAQHRTAKHNYALDHNHSATDNYKVILYKVIFYWIV